MCIHYQINIIYSPLKNRYDANGEKNAIIDSSFVSPYSSPVGDKDLQNNKINWYLL